MDGSRFDTLTRALSAVPTRRGILQALIAALTGDALCLARVEAADCPGFGVSTPCDSDGDCAGEKGRALVGALRAHLEPVMDFERRW